jgi:hypothetical protein
MKLTVLSLAANTSRVTGHLNGVECPFPDALWATAVGQFEGRQGVVSEPSLF